MSYTRSFTRGISVPYSGSVTVSYPASEHGGVTTAHYRGTAYEDVTVNVKVDTNPFDASVNNTNNHVNVLTGAVVATEAAEIAAIEKSSNQVAKTIVSGFFSLIRSDISQQVMELSKSIESHLYHLKELGKRCVNKQKQMEADYNRLASNYTKIFGDLNSELTHRIKELNKPVFVFRKECVSQTDRMGNDDMLSTVSISGSEEASLQAQIQASFIKRRAADTLESANEFLIKQKNTANTIDRSMIDSQEEGERYVPICYLEIMGENNFKGNDIYHPQVYPIINPQQLNNQLKDIDWGKMDKDSKETINRFFYQEIATYFHDSDDHNLRVRDVTIKLFSNNTKI